MIFEYLLTRGLEESLRAVKDIAKKVLNEKGSRLVTTQADIEDSLNIHLRSVKNWSSSISFNDLRESKNTIDVFVELDLFVSPRRIRIDQNETIENIPFRNLLDHCDHHLVLLGQPGAGKTTSMKYVCQLLLHDETFEYERFSFPVLIKLRELNGESVSPDTNLIFDHLFRLFGLRIALTEGKSKQNPLSSTEHRTLRKKLVISLLEEFRVLLILDGFDELAQSQHRDRAISEMTELATHLERSTMLVTSRTGDFKYSIENTEQFELCPLNPEQIESFALRWLGDPKKASDFLKKVYRTPFADTAIRPLTLAHLCAIYERTQDIPEKPKTVYKKIITLLLEDWDQQRFIKRISRYAHFEIDRKYDFLCQLAYMLTKTLRTTVFSTQDLLSALRSFLDDYGLRLADAEQVLSEVETHNGLFLQSGFDQYEFAHKSLQEFLTAEYLVKLPNIPDNWKVLMLVPNELAIAVAISSNPASYFISLVVTRFKNQKLSESFVRAFLSRILIEKPDFRPGAWLDLAFLTLYSIYVEYNLKGDETKVFDLDLVFRDFEKLIRERQTKSMGTFLSCYRSEHEYQTEDDDNIHRLKLVKKLSGMAVKPLMDDLPEKLLIRSSFLQP